MLNRPDVIQGVHESMLDAGAEVLETDTFQAQPPEARGVGPRRAHARDQPKRRPRSPARRPARTASSPGSIGPTGHLPASDDPTLGKITFRELVDVFDRAGARPRRGRRRPDHHRDGAGHPRGQGRGLRRARGVQADRPGAADPVLGVAAAAGRQDAPRHRHPGGRSPRSPRSTWTWSGSTARPAPRTCATRSATSARAARCRCTASRTPACRSRAPRARRSSPRSRTRWRPRCRSSWSATASRSWAAAAARRPTTSRRSWTAWAGAPPRRGPRQSIPLVSSMMTATAARAGAAARRWSASA